MLHPQIVSLEVVLFKGGRSSRCVGPIAVRARAASLIALQFVDEVARLPDAEFVRGGQAEAFPEHPNEVDLPASSDGPDGFDLRSRGGTGAGGVTEDGTVGVTCLGTFGRDRNAPNRRARADLDDFLRLGVGLAGFALPVAGESGDLVFDGLLTRLVGPLDDDLEALAVLEQAGIEFCLDGASGRGTGEAGQTDWHRHEQRHR